MEHYGPFPWGEIAVQALSIVMAYFAGRYRKVKKEGE